MIIRLSKTVMPCLFLHVTIEPRVLQSNRHLAGEGFKRNEIAVADGQLTVAEVRLTTEGQPTRVAVMLRGAPAAASLKAAAGGVVVTLAAPLALKAGEALVITLA